MQLTKKQVVLSMHDIYIDSLVMISIEKSETNKKKSTGNLRQICLGPWSILSLWQKSGTNFQCSFFICVGLFNAYHHFVFSQTN